MVRSFTRFVAQPTTNPLHKGQSTIGRFTHADQENQWVTFYNLNLIFAPTGSGTQFLRSATKAT
jgi:hypothetical protein